MEILSAICRRESSFGFYYSALSSLPVTPWNINGLPGRTRTLYPALSLFLLPSLPLLLPLLGFMGAARGSRFVWAKVSVIGLN